MDFFAKMVNDCGDLAALRKQSPVLELVFQKGFLVSKFTLCKALAIRVYNDLDKMVKYGVTLLDSNEDIDRHIKRFAMTVVYDDPFCWWFDCDREMPPETFTDLDIFVDKCFFWHVDDDNEYRFLTIKPIDEYDDPDIVHTDSEDSPANSWAW